MSNQSRLIGFHTTESTAFEVEVTAPAISQVWSVEDPGGTPVWVDETANFNNPAGSPNDYKPIGTAGAVGDIGYWGHANQMKGLVLNGSGGEPGEDGLVTWEYWNGSSWSALTLTTDDTNDGSSSLRLSEADDLEVIWTVPGDWGTTTVNGSAALYYVRARVTTLFTTPPSYDDGEVMTGAYSVTLTDGDWWPSGDGDTTADGEGDLLAHLEARVQAVGGTPLANFSATVNRFTGIVSISLGSGETGTLTWTAAGTDLRDFLRFSGATLALSSTAQQGSQAHELGFYPLFTAIEDLPFEEQVSNQTRSDTGRVWTVTYASRAEWKLSFRFSDGPRDGLDTEYASLRDLWINHMDQGKRFRHYPFRALGDGTGGVTDAFVFGTTPNGYHELIMQSQPWEPIPFEDGWYDYFDVDIRGFEYVS